LKIDELVKSPYCSLNDHLSQNAQSRSQMTFYETVKIAGGKIKTDEKIVWEILNVD